MKKKHHINEIEVEAAKINLKQPLGRFLIVLFRQFEDELMAELSKKGHRTVSAADLNVLRHIDPKGISANRIAELAGVTKQAISKQIGKLEKEGLIKREVDTEDQRAQQIVFTKKGEKLIYDSIAIIEKIENRFANVLGGSRQLEKVKSTLNSLIKK